MRNLKRVLSLTLASVMLMGMMVVGAGAKGIDDYADKAEIVNQDAVAVTTAIGIFDGYEDGSFGPDRIVTRAEMAVIICKMLYGADVNAGQFTDQNAFTDVPAWAAGYVNLCYSLGIVAGVGDNKYDPNSTVTTAQASLMLAKALGYFRSEADYGTNWMLAATSKGAQLGMYGELNLTAEAGLTRQDVAEMTFNTLVNAVPVEYSEMFNVYYNVNSGLIYGLEFNFLETLGYTNFDLVYKNAGTIDAQGRPAITWGVGSVTRGDDSVDERGDLISKYVTLLSRNEIITMAREADYVYTSATKSKAIYADLGKELCDAGETAWTVYYNGLELDTDTSPLTFTEENAPSTRTHNFYLPTKGDNGDYDWLNNGEVVEIYLEKTTVKDDEKFEVTAVIYGNYVGEVSRVNSGEVSIDTGFMKVENKAPRSFILDTKTFETEEFAAEDKIGYTIGYDDDANKYFVFSVYEPQTTEGALTAYSLSNMNVYIDSTKNKLSNHYNNKIEISMETQRTAEKEIDINGTYRFFMDPNGFVAGIEPIDAETNRYVYVEKIDWRLSKLIADVVFPDGSEKEITIAELYNYSGVDFSHGIAGNKLAALDAEFGMNPARDLLDYYEAEDVADALNNGYFTGTVAKGFVAAYEENGTSYDLDILVFNQAVDANNPIKNKTSSFDFLQTAGFLQKMNVSELDSKNNIVTTAMASRVRLSNDTIFVDIDTGKVYVGIDNVPSYVGASAAFGAEYGIDDKDEYYSVDSYADVVFITSGEADDDNKTYFWLTSASNTSSDVYHTTTEGTKYLRYENAYVKAVKEKVFVRETAGVETNIGLYAIHRTDSNTYGKNTVPLIGVGGFTTNTSGIGTINRNQITLGNGHKTTDNLYYADHLSVVGEGYDFYYVPQAHIDDVTSSGVIHLVDGLTYSFESTNNIDSINVRNAEFYVIGYNDKNRLGKTVTSGSYSDIVTYEKYSKSTTGYDYYTEIFVVDYEDAEHADQATVVYLVKIPMTESKGTGTTSKGTIVEVAPVATDPGFNGTYDIFYRGTAPTTEQIANGIADKLGLAAGDVVYSDLTHYFYYRLGSGDQKVYNINNVIATYTVTVNGANVSGYVPNTGSYTIPKTYFTAGTYYSIDNGTTWTAVTSEDVNGLPITNITGDVTVLTNRYQVTLNGSHNYVELNKTIALTGAYYFNGTTYEVVPTSGNYTVTGNATLVDDYYTYTINDAASSKTYAVAGSTVTAAGLTSYGAVGTNYVKNGQTFTMPAENFDIVDGYSKVTTTVTADTASGVTLATQTVADKFLKTADSYTVDLALTGTATADVTLSATGAGMTFAPANSAVIVNNTDAAANVTVTVTAGTMATDVAVTLTIA